MTTRGLLLPPFAAHPTTALLWALNVIFLISGALLLAGGIVGDPKLFAYGSKLTYLIFGISVIVAILMALANSKVRTDPDSTMKVSRTPILLLIPSAVFFGAAAVTGFIIAVN